MPAKKKEPTVEEKWAAYDRALVITAHPDDAEFMAGGTMAKLCDIGLQVTLAVATSGDKGTRDVNLRRQELAAMREQEQRAAAKVLGLYDVKFLGYPDGFLIEDEAMRGHVVRLIRTLQPDLIVTWDGFRPGFNHTDHRVVGRAVRDALYPAAHDPHYYRELERIGRTSREASDARAEAADEHEGIEAEGRGQDQGPEALGAHAATDGPDPQGPHAGHQRRLLRRWRPRGPVPHHRRHPEPDPPVDPHPGTPWRGRGCDPTLPQVPLHLQIRPQGPLQRARVSLIEISVPGRRGRRQCGEDHIGDDDRVEPGLAVDHRRIAVGDAGKEGGDLRAEIVGMRKRDGLGPAVDRYGEARSAEVGEIGPAIFLDMQRPLRLVGDATRAPCAGGLVT